VVEALGIGPGTRVIDLGAGTGKLTRQMLASGAEIVAVEPLAEMRAVFTETVPGVTILEGTAEALPFSDDTVNAVVAGQAWHWFDPEMALREIERVLAEGGALALLWNDYDLSVPWVRELDALRVRYQSAGVPSQRSGDWRDVFRDRPGWGPLVERRFAHVQETTPEGIVRRMMTSSVIANLPQDEQQAVAEEVRRLIPAPEKGSDVHGDPSLVLPYVTQVYWSVRR
jgi:SAM-dependent methyltransferase